MIQRLFLRVLVCLVGVLVLPLPAFAYVGPGAGLTVIGTIVAVVGAIFLLIVGFLWYPLKRLIKGKKEPQPMTGKPEPRDDAT